MTSQPSRKGLLGFCCLGGDYGSTERRLSLETTFVIAEAPVLHSWPFFFLREWYPSIAFCCCTVRMLISEKSLTSGLG